MEAKDIPPEERRELLELLKNHLGDSKYYELRQRFSEEEILNLYCQATGKSVAKKSYGWVLWVLLLIAAVAIFIFGGEDALEGVFNLVGICIGVYYIIKIVMWLWAKVTESLDSFNDRYRY